MAGQQESFTKFTLGNIAAALGFAVTAVNLFTALKGVAVNTQLLVLGASLVVSGFSFWTLKEFWIPKANWEETKSCVRFGIHMSEIRSYLQELNILNTISNNSPIASDLRERNLMLLRETVGHVEKLTLELKTNKTYIHCLEELKTSELATDEVVTKARAAIGGK
jgi:hypothetical protein